MTDNKQQIEPAQNKPPAKQPTTLVELIQSPSMRAQITMALPRTLTIDRFVRAAMTEFRRTPKLLECSRESVLGGLMKAAQLGLELGTLGTAWLLPFKGEAVFIMGYRGAVELCYRSEKIRRIETGVVRAGDFFEYERGTTSRLVHREAPTGRGEMLCAWALAETKDGGCVWDIAWPERIARARASSQSANSSYSPWQTDEEAMWRKTAVLHAAKLWPLTTDPWVDDEAPEAQGRGKIVIEEPAPATEAVP